MFAIRGKAEGGGSSMFKRFPRVLADAGLGAMLLGAMMMPASADGLKDEIAPTGKLRVAIAIRSRCPAKTLT